MKAAYRADYIERRVARGETAGRRSRRSSTGSTADESTSAIGGRIWRELSPLHVLYSPDGTPFTAAEMAADPKHFTARNAADPVEGMGYQTRNCGFILHQGGRVEIYSRAHGDRYAYFLPLSDEEDFSEDSERPDLTTGSNHGGLLAAAAVGNSAGVGRSGGGGGGNVRQPSGRVRWQE